MRDTRYLKRRVGKGRSGERWYVRVPIPKDIQDRFGRAKSIERALKTSDLQEARRRRHAVIAEIFDTIERAKHGGLTSAEIEAEAQRYFRENLETLRDRPGDPDARWTRQTELQYRTSCRLFADYVQNTPLDAVTREDAADFLTTLGRLHPNYGRSSKSKRLSLDQLLKRFGGKVGLSNATLNRHLRALNGLFKWAAQAGLYDRRTYPC